MRRDILLLFATLLTLISCNSSLLKPQFPKPSKEDRAITATIEPTNKKELSRLTGEIVIDGSSTVYPIVAAAAEEFMQYAPDVKISVGVSGTGGGFKKFTSSETDINNASRPIDPKEIELSKKNGVDFIELPIAFDGIVVVVSKKNSWVECLTLDELKTVWAVESQNRIKNWQQIRASFPDRPIVLYGPGTDSGTFDYFTQAINGKEKSSRGDFQASEDDNILVRGVANDENALAFFSYVYFAENRDKLRAVGIVQKRDCIHPSADTIKQGAYQPLSRPTFIYINRKSADRSEVDAFISFLFSKNFVPLIASREVGHIPFADTFYNCLLKRFQSRVTGTLLSKGSEIGIERYCAG